MPGSLAIEAAGQHGGGLHDHGHDAGAGRQARLSGAVQPAGRGLSALNGKLSLRATDAGPLLAASGPSASPTCRRRCSVDDAAGLGATASGRCPASPGRLGRRDLRRRGQPHAGTGARRPPADRPAAPARPDGGTFLDWSGPAAGLETGFATALPFGLTGQLWLTPSALEVHPSLHREERRDRHRGEGRRTIHLAMLGKDEDGRDAQIELTSAGTDESRKLIGPSAHAGRPRAAAGAGRAARPWPRARARST